MKRILQLRFAAAALAVLAVLVTSPVRVAAHAPGGATFLITQVDGYSANLDGFCDQAEYGLAGHRAVPYGDNAYSTVYAIASATELFVCVTSVPDHYPEVENISLYFDPDHNGGNQPDADDRRVQLRASGSNAPTIATFGTAWGSISTPTGLTGAVIHPAGDTDFWDFEIRTPLSALGSPSSTAIGLDVVISADTRTWSWTNGDPLRPTTWGHGVWWPGTAANPNAIVVGAWDVSQGPIYDVSAAASPHLITGKDLLLRANLSKGQVPRAIVQPLNCRVTSPTGRSLTVAGTGRTLGRYRSFSLWSGATTADSTERCWLAGSWFYEPGYYRFEMYFTLQGEVLPRSVNLGTKYIGPSCNSVTLSIHCDLRILLWPFVDRTADPNPVSSKILGTSSASEWTQVFTVAGPVTMTGLGLYLAKTATIDGNGLRFRIVGPLSGTSPSDAADNFADLVVSDAQLSSNFRWVYTSFPAAFPLPAGTYGIRYIAQTDGDGRLGAFNSNVYQGGDLWKETAGIYTDVGVNAAFRIRSNENDIVQSTGDPNRREWDADLLLALVTQLQDVERIMPLRGGTVGELDQSRSGLRYSWNGIIDVCTTDCTVEYSRAADAVERYNGESIRRQNNTSFLWDRIDWGAILDSVNVSGNGGQACHSGTEASTINNVQRGPSATVIVQELSHCMGLVGATSPNSDTPGVPGVHSVRALLPADVTRPAVDFLFRRDVPALWNVYSGQLQPASAMWYQAGGFNASVSFLEGREWNDLYDWLRAPRCFGLLCPNVIGGSPVKYVSMQSAPELFHAVGTLERSQLCTPPCYPTPHVSYAEALDTPLEVTADDPDGQYTLVLLDAANGSVGSLQFGSAVNDTHQNYISNLEFVLTTPLPTGATHWQIRQSGAVLYEEVFSPTPPTITKIEVASNSTNVDGHDGFNLTLEASDADSTLIRLNVFYQRTSDDIPVLVAAGVPATSGVPVSLFLETVVPPATNDGRFLLEATDGYGVAQQLSSPVSVAETPPLVTIVSPGDGGVLTEGVPTTLYGVAFSSADGLLDEAHLNWSSSVDGALGTGTQLTRALSPGDHILTLTATSSSAESSSVSILVKVRSDGDGDGIADLDEVPWNCMSAAIADGDTDPDGDMLTSIDELVLHSNPCAADSDDDGVTDDIEAAFGSNPNSYDSVPAPPRFSVSTDDIDLGMCPGATTRSVQVGAFVPEASWVAVSDSPWLSTTPKAGTGAGAIDLVADCTDLAPGNYVAQLFVSELSSGQTLPVNAVVHVGATGVGGAAEQIDPSTLPPLSGTARHRVALYIVGAIAASVATISGAAGWRRRRTLDRT